MKQMRTTIFAAVLALMPQLAAVGQDFGAGVEAYVHGDYAIALQDWQPLAELGDADAQRNFGMMYEAWWRFCPGGARIWGGNKTRPYYL